MTKDLVVPGNLVIDKDCIDLLKKHICIRIQEQHRSNNNKDLDIRVASNYLKVKYKNRIYKVSIVKEDNKYYWYLKPYNKNCFMTSADDNNSFDTVVFAIKEHDKLYLKKLNKV